jgi:hypothetical protein
LCEAVIGANIFKSSLTLTYLKLKNTGRNRPTGGIPSDIQDKGTTMDVSVHCVEYSHPVLAKETP